LSGQPDLKAEVDAALARVKKRDFSSMETLGVPLNAIARLGVKQPQFGLAAIEEHRDGTYSPVDDGKIAIIVPVMMPDAFEVFGIKCESMEIVDLVAFRSEAPTRWCWRTGEGWALGAWLLHHDAPIRLVAHPLQWLAAAGEALCILDWNLTPRRWRELRNGPPITADDDLLRRRLNAEFAQQLPPLVMSPSFVRKGKPRAA